MDEEKQAKIERGLNKLIQKYFQAQRAYISLAGSGMAYASDERDERAVEVADQFRRRLADAAYAMDMAMSAVKREYNYWVREYLPEPLNAYINRAWKQEIDARIEEVSHAKAKS